MLINNAGICRGKTILDATERDIALTFAVNTTAHFLLTKAFLPSMIAADHGHIVTVASIGGFVQAPRMVDYNASKAAAVAFHEGLGLELKYKYNALKVRTTMVAQGLVNTPLFEGFKNDSKFMLPELLPETLAEAIVERVWTAQGGQVVLPKAYNMLMGAVSSLVAPQEYMYGILTTSAWLGELAPPRAPREHQGLDDKLRREAGYGDREEAVKFVNYPKSHFFSVLCSRLIIVQQPTLRPC